MRIVEVLALLLVLLSLPPSAVLAEGGDQSPLQLAPGSGVQPPGGQMSPQPPGTFSGQRVGVQGEREQLRDIHPPLPLPEEADYVIAVAGLLLLLLVFALVSWFFRHRRKGRKNGFVPPHETALAELLELRSSMSAEQALHYARELADILRRYVEKRFLIRTSRQTTKEFFASLSKKPGRYDSLLADHGDHLKSCLDQCDMAKFARCTPDLRSMENMESAVREFVEASRNEREEEK